jgi:hypothetical protein
MRDQILEIISNKPKHYTRIIKGNDQLRKWVEQETLVKSENFSEMIYSALHKVTNICDLGKIKKFDRISSGFYGCGPASVCECTRHSISVNVSNSKSKISISEKHDSNIKRSKTILEKYGVEYNSQRTEIKQIWKKPKISDDSLIKLTNYEWLNTEYNIKKRSLVDIAKELQVYYSTVTEYCKKFNFKIRQTSNYSLIEKEICTFLDELKINYIENDWDILENQEIDILIPEKNIGIEINGLYWHSYHPDSNEFEDKHKHLSKTKKAALKNINIIHITDYEWIHKKSIIKNMLKSKLGLNERIYARECEIRIVPKKQEKYFLNNYHLQGFIPSSICYGLYHENLLVMVISIGKSRFSKNHILEILRVCSTDNKTIVGGLSKLIHKIKKDFKNIKIITYCDRSKSTGSSYIKVGFNQIGESSPGYIWTNGNLVFSRYKCQKSNMKKWLKPFNPDLSESQNMFLNKFRRYWDCGNLIFEI